MRAALIQSVLPIFAPMPLAVGEADGPTGARCRVRPTTGPADAPPVIDDVKKDIHDALKKEYARVLEGKLTMPQADKVWDRVAKASDADINHLAQDLIDPSVSDSDLESRRLEFSGKFLDSVRAALDKTASDEVAGELLKQFRDRPAMRSRDAYKGAVKNTVGAAVAQGMARCRPNESVGRGPARSRYSRRIGIGQVRRRQSRADSRSGEGPEARGVQEAKGEPAAVQPDPRCRPGKTATSRLGNSERSG